MSAFGLPKGSRSQFLFLSLLLVSAEICSASQQLVMFAGPHKSASTSIESFFYQYASGHSRSDDDGTVKSKEERQKTFGLRYWLWPRIHGVVAEEMEKEHPYKIFGHLVTDSENAMLRDEILNGIRDAWETDGLEGVIMGTEMFDQIGDYGAPYDAIHAMRKVVNYLQVEPSQVTVALNYRTPRLEHWASIWAHDTQLGDAANYTVEYEDWLCDTDQVANHVQILQTQLNPLNAAEVFVQEGWNVRLVDMEGVKLAGRDINHVIACDVATARCDGGTVLNHEKDNPHENVIAAEFSALTEVQRMQAEELFRARDCAYMQALRTNVQFAVIYNHSVWESCNSNMTAVYTGLKDDPSLMYRALRSQVECPKHGGSEGEERQHKDAAEIEHILSGKYFEKAEPKSSGKARINGKPKRTAAGMFLEFLGFIFIVIGAMAFQYQRMVKTGRPHYGVGSRSIDTAAALQEAESEGQSTNAAAVDAEYGDVADDDDDDDANSPSGYRD